MSSIQATDSGTTKFLELLVKISEHQKTICKLLDELMQLLDMPSEYVLKLLARLLVPMGHGMDKPAQNMKIEVIRSELP
ncbi:hypothetical protein [Azohydromonas australica]|uniref:hypothetical protein n=1 Tax=Azohydromonas australica TaxID=364039 RepID=UPI0003FEE938|nr:hypothetical protein [Azohydromonas australica]